MNIATILNALSTGKNVTISFRKDVKLNKGGRAGTPVNAMYGRVHKKTLDMPIKVFASAEAFHADVTARKEEKGEMAWKPKQRSWGNRIDNGPVIAHTNKDGVVKYYLEVESRGKGKTRYYLDQNQIDKEEITGLPSRKKPEPALDGIGDVQVRCIELSHVESIEIDGREMIGPFAYTAPCPFCGETKKVHVIAATPLDESKPPYFMTCNSCRTTGPVGDSEEEAQQFWNNRCK